MKSSYTQVKIYEINKKRSTSKTNQSNLMQQKFIGFLKHRPDWQGKSNLEITKELRQTAW